MEYLQINESKCVGCGACLGATDLVEETAEGKAKVKNKVVLKGKQLSKAKEIMADCPAQAISLVKGANVVKADIGSLIRKLESDLTKELQGIQKISQSDVKFDADQYSVDFPEAIYGSYSNYEYSSSTKATKAALALFDRYVYSQYRRFILEVFVKYKLDKLRHYYIQERGGFIYELNKKFEAMLKDFASQVDAVGKSGLPKNFTKFEILPDPFLELLSEFEENSTNSGIMKEFRSGSYSSLSDYDMYIDTDCIEVGECFFGGAKLKWRHESLLEATTEYIKDLKSSMNYVDIDEHAMHLVNHMIEDYQRVGKDLIAEKIRQAQAVK